RAGELPVGVIGGGGDAVVGVLDAAGALGPVVDVGRGVAGLVLQRFELVVVVISPRGHAAVGIDRLYLAVGVVVIVRGRVAQRPAFALQLPIVVIGAGDDLIERPADGDRAVGLVVDVGPPVIARCAGALGCR